MTLPRMTVRRILDHREHQAKPFRSWLRFVVRVERASLARGRREKKLLRCCCHWVRWSRSCHKDPEEEEDAGKGGGGGISNS